MKRILAALVVAFALGNAGAQAPVATQAGASGTAASEGSITASTAAGPACCRIPANTVVDLEILDLLNSSRQQRGDKFRFRVVTPVLIDGIVRVAVGAPGIGEIVHAAAARGGGAPGELLIAARSLDIEGQAVALRGLKLGVTGGDNSGMALGVAFAAGGFAFFIRGHEIEIPIGTRVTAKVAHDVSLSPTIAFPATTVLIKE